MTASAGQSFDPLFVYFKSSLLIFLFYSLSYFLSNFLFDIAGSDPACFTLVLENWIVGADKRRFWLVPRKAVLQLSLLIVASMLNFPTYIPPKENTEIKFLYNDFWQCNVAGCCSLACSSDVVRTK